jgi:hypothetical protein
MRKATSPETIQLDLNKLAKAASHVVGLSI